MKPKRCYFQDGSWAYALVDDRGVSIIFDCLMPDTYRIPGKLFYVVSGLVTKELTAGDQNLYRFFGTQLTDLINYTSHADLIVINSTGVVAMVLNHGLSPLTSLDIAVVRNVPMMSLNGIELKIEPDAPHLANSSWGYIDSEGLLTPAYIGALKSVMYRGGKVYRLFRRGGIVNNRQNGLVLAIYPYDPKYGFSAPLGDKGDIDDISFLSGMTVVE